MNKSNLFAFLAELVSNYHSCPDCGAECQSMSYTWISAKTSLNRFRGQSRALIGAVENVPQHFKARDNGWKGFVHPLSQLRDPSSDSNCHIILFSNGCIKCGDEYGLS
ncbi:hypothetical protein CDAR_478211 [Caerostris darwini]|uniref:Uncharacterized protein n=1 Tax=Caerostris darwini TaxID=1538125 RepID=A0AAV4UJT9_9ARAC|nr:hypothetical protein CDAR_478211 [Caerostris darwini]